MDHQINENISLPAICVSRPKRLDQKVKAAYRGIWKDVWIRTRVKTF